MNSDEDFLELPTEYDLAPTQHAPRPPVVPPPPPIPVPVAALSYSMPLRERRPGLVTAIGVIGIIVASISMLSCLSVGFSDFGFFAMSAMSSSLAAAPRPTATVNVASIGTPGTPGTPAAPTYIPPNDDAIANDGLKQSDRIVVEGALASLQTIDNSQFNELDNFLAQTGQSAFPNAGLPLSKELVTSQVTRSGAYKGSGQDDPSYTWFDVSWGRLEVYDDKVSLSKSNPSLPPITTSIALPQYSSAVNPGFAALTPKEINTVIKQVNLMAPNAMDTGQTSALKKVLASPQQTLVPAMFLANPVTGAQQNPDGSMLVSFTGGGSVKINSGGATVTTVASQPFVMPKFQISNGAIAISMIEAVASFGIAIFLLVISIQAFRGSHNTPRRFRIYAWIKIPLAIIGWFATGLVYWGLGQGFGSVVPNGGSSVARVYVVMAIFGGVAALLFPVALLFVLHSKTVREYYEAA